MEGPVVITPNGKLRGVLGTNIEGETIVKFFGIPYARPPVGDLRFMPPQALEPWTGILDATEEGKRPVSRDDLSFELGGSEDCLNVNVYVKGIPKPNEPLKPVMVYIYGGGLVTGCNRPGIYGPDFLMTKDIILVVMNYRLGVLGFLSVDGTEVYGNMGLKDQNFALKWVKNNIKCFGGDPGNVTIFGESAGGASVHAHILSPASKGLFHRAILQSGCTLNYWFFAQKNTARKIVSFLGQSADTEKEALDVLKKTPAIDIIGAQEKAEAVSGASFRRPIGAVVETDNESAFLTEHPRDIIRKGTYNHVPLIMGYTDSEGLLKTYIKLAFKVAQPPFDLAKEIPYDLNAPPGTEENTKIVDLLKNVYHQQEGDEHCDEISDSWFLASQFEVLREHLKTSTTPIYLYRISLVTKLNHLRCKLKLCGEQFARPGVAHADELGFLWHMDITPSIEPGSPEQHAWRLFVDLWTNFARFGEPTPNKDRGITWTPVESIEHWEVFDIGEKLEIKEIPEKKRLEAWLQVYDSRRAVLLKDS